MVVAIVLILLIIGAAIVGALYSSFLAFYTNFGDTIAYNKAYYAAISGLERAELVLRYRLPGYQGSGGWLATANWGEKADHQPKDFGYFFTGEENGILREIASRTKRIPATGQGNVEWTLVTGDARDYNKLDYLNAENFIFSVDDLSKKPYEKGGRTESQLTSFSGTIRLPPFLRRDGGFEKLNENDDIDGDDINNDAMVDWSLQGKYDGDDFQIMSTRDINYTDKKIKPNNDSVIRESRINSENGAVLNFNNNKNPFSSVGTGLTVISAKEDELKGLNFSQLTNNTKITDKKFRLSLLNLLTSTNGLIYPYLEYQFSFPTEIADRFYKITTIGKYGNYEVKLLVEKPTIKESILGSFTVIF